MAAKQLIILLLTGCLVMACTKEVITYIEPSDTEKVPVSFEINLSGISTRSTWEYNEYFPSDEPTLEEMEVSNILIVAFKDVYLEEFDFFNDKGTDFIQRPEGSLYLGHDETEQNIIDLEPGYHFFYVILNIPDDLYENTIKPQLENGTNTLHKDDFERNILNVTLNGLTNGVNGFIMTNTNAPTAIPIYSAEQINSSGSNLLHNRISLNVGRAVAKISMAYTPIPTGIQHGGLTDIKYQIAYNPSQIYLMPVIENNKLITPHYNSSTIIAGYFSPTVYDIAEGITNNWLDATTTDTSPENMTYTYCIENSNKTVRAENSTMLVVKAQYHPEEWLNADGTEGPASSDGTYYRIAQYDTNGKLLNYYQGYYNNPPIIDKPNEYCEAVEYPKGICYYTLRITDNNDEYVVKRNSFYKIAITHIHSSGEPLPTVDEPDEKYAWGRIEIWGTDWIENNQEEGLGEDPDDLIDLDTDPDVKEWEDEEEQDKKLEDGDEKNIFN